MRQNRRNRIKTEVEKPDRGESDREAGTEVWDVAGEEGEGSSEVRETLLLS